jgi:hypothetical protein
MTTHQRKRLQEVLHDLIKTEPDKITEALYRDNNNA